MENSTGEVSKKGRLIGIREFVNLPAVSILEVAAVYKESVLEEEDEFQQLEMPLSAQSELTVTNTGDDNIESRSRGEARKGGHIAIGLSIMSITGGGLVKLPEEAFHQVLYKAYNIIALASFLLALFGLIISYGMFPNAHKFVSVALKLMRLALVMQLLALIMATILIFLI